MQWLVKIRKILKVSSLHRLRLNSMRMLPRKIAKNPGVSPGSETLFQRDFAKRGD